MKKKTESWNSRWTRFLFNLYPTYRGTGGRITLMSADWKHIQLKLKLGLRTRNYVGTIYGGSMLSSTDPFYMLMLMKNLGKDYVVWDMEANIKFKKPGTETLYAEFILEDREIEVVKTLIAQEQKTVREYPVYLKDKAGNVIAEMKRTIYIASKEYYKNRKKQKA